MGSRAGSKGLRHFSMKVCEKVESKQRTTYNEVADELVAELPITGGAGADIIQGWPCVAGSICCFCMSFTRMLTA